MADRPVSLAEEVIAELRKWPVPQVRSETELDRKVRDFVRRQVARQLPSLPGDELKCWVAGHGEPKPHDAFWSKSKQYQNICLWGASKTADLFIYHPRSSYGLPKRGISVEVKLVSGGSSYAGAIATVAGQLLAYSLRHEQRKREPTNDGRVERCNELLALLPENASLIVRFAK
jgi:hypothetical protein